MRSVYIALVVAVLSCQSIKRMDTVHVAQDTVVYVVQSNVELLMKKQLERIGNNVFFELSKISDRQFEIDLIEIEKGTIEKKYNKTNRFILINKMFYPLIFDYDDVFSVSNSPKEILDEFNKVEYPTFRSQIVIQHYFYFVRFNLNGEILCDGYDGTRSR